MIARKILLLVAAAAALAAAVGVFVVALAFALYAVARDYVGPAGAAAIVAGAAALLLVLAALVVLIKAGLGRRKREPSMVERAKDFVRERPIAAAAAALAAGVVAIRNPSLLAALVFSFLESKPSKKKR